MPKTLEAISSKPGDIGHFMVLAMALYEHSTRARRLTRKQLRQFDKEIKELTLEARTAIHDLLLVEDGEYIATYGSLDRIFRDSANYFKTRYIMISSKR